MIDISQWRINIGLWHCCHVLRSATKGAVNVTGLVESLLCSENGDVTNLVFSLIIFLLLLLILSGDVEFNPGPLTDIRNNLKKIPRHYDMLCLLADMQNSWRDIGFALRVSSDYLDGLSCSPDHPRTKLSNVIRNWIDSRSSPVTWNTVISAIEYPIVNNKRKADEIRDYLGRKQKRLGSNISESDKDVPPRKPKSLTLTSDSDSESYDTLSSWDKEPASGRPYKKKRMPHIKKRITHKHKGEKQKRLRSNISVSDKDISLRKQTFPTVSSDSELESYYKSSIRIRGKKPASGRYYMRKGTFHKITSSRIPHEHKGGPKMMQHSKTKDVDIQKFQLVTKHSTQLKEEVAEMMQRSETKDLELERLPLVKDEAIQLKEGMVIVGENYSKFSAAKDQQLSVEECGLNILIPAQVISPVDTLYEISANGLWGEKFEFPENSTLISGVCYISISNSSQLNKPVTILLEHCVNITDDKQAEYLSFVVAKSGPPFRFEYLSGGSFRPNLQYGTIHLKEFSYIAIVLCVAFGGATLGLVGGVVGSVFSSAMLDLGGVALGATVGGAIGYHYATNTAELPDCKYRGYVFYELVNVETWKMRFTVVQDNTYSDKTLKLKSKFGNEEDNFPFRFATKVSEENLKLLGFPDEAVDGWEITPLRTPLVINRKDADDFSQSRSVNPPNIPVQVTANPRMSDFKNNLKHTITIEGIEVTESQALPTIVITRSLMSNLQSNIVKGGVHVSSLPDHILDQQPTIQEITTHAKTEKWNELGTQLQLNSVNLAECHSLTSMYQLWIQEKADKATRRSLLDALRTIKQNNVAMVYENYLKNQ